MMLKFTTKTWCFEQDDQNALMWWCDWRRLLRCPEVLVMGRMESLLWRCWIWILDIPRVPMESVLALHTLGSRPEMSWMPVLLLECVYNTITPWISWSQFLKYLLQSVNNKSLFSSVKKGGKYVIDFVWISYIAHEWKVFKNQNECLSILCVVY